MTLPGGRLYRRVTHSPQILVAPRNCDLAWVDASNGENKNAETNHDHIGISNLQLLSLSIGTSPYHPFLVIGTSMV